MTSLNVANARSVVTKMSSREIAELTGKRHDHVLRDCRKMFEALNIQSPQIWGDYQDSSGRHYREALLDQDLTMTLVMGYSIPLRHKVAKRWRELETGEALPTKSNSGLPEYRRARTLKMTVEAVTNLFDLMPHLAPEAKQVAAASPHQPGSRFRCNPASGDGREPLLSGRGGENAGCVGEQNWPHRQQAQPQN